MALHQCMAPCSTLPRPQAVGIYCSADHIGGSDINVCRTLGDYDLGLPLKGRDEMGQQLGPLISGARAGRGARRVGRAQAGMPPGASLGRRCPGIGRARPSKYLGKCCSSLVLQCACPPACLALQSPTSSAYRSMTWQSSSSQPATVRAAPQWPVPPPFCHSRPHRTPPAPARGWAPSVKCGRSTALRPCIVGMFVAGACDVCVLVAVAGLWDYYSPESSVLSDTRRQMRRLNEDPQEVNAALLRRAPRCLGGWTPTPWLRRLAPAPRLHRDAPLQAAQTGDGS